MKIAFFTDPHLHFTQKPSPLELIGKPFTGYLNWQKRKDRHSTEVLASLIEDMHAQKPDLYICGGDIVNLGLPHEVENARAFLAQFNPSLYTPGNHDAYTRTGEKLMQPLFEPHYPAVRESENTIVIGLNTATPMPPFYATGVVGYAQMQELRELLTTHKYKNRIIVMHHPPLEIEGGKSHKRLTDMAAFQAVIKETGAELILHGHTHRNSLHMLYNTPVYGIASCSGTHLAHDLASWGLIEVTKSVAVTLRQPSKGLLK